MTIAVWRVCPGGPFHPLKDKRGESTWFVDSPSSAIMLKVTVRGLRPARQRIWLQSAYRAGTMKAAMIQVGLVCLLGTND